MKLLVISLLVTMPYAARGEDTIDAVEKKIEQAWAANKTLAAVIAMTGSQKQGDQVITMAGTGRFEWMREGDDEKTRMSFDSTATLGDGEGARKIESSSLVISDGEFLHSMLTRGGHSDAYKQKLEQHEDLGGGRALKQLRETGNKLSVLPDEKIGDRDVYVILAAPKQPDPQSPEKDATVYVDQQTGIVLKRVVRGADNEPIFTMLLTDLEINKPIKPEQFIFKAPEGVTVLDMTGN